MYVEVTYMYVYVLSYGFVLTHVLVGSPQSETICMEFMVIDDDFVKCLSLNQWYWRGNFCLCLGNFLFVGIVLLVLGLLWFCLWLFGLTARWICMKTSRITRIIVFDWICMYCIYSIPLRVIIEPTFLQAYIQVYSKYDSISCVYT